MLDYHRTMYRRTMYHWQESTVIVTRSLVFWFLHRAYCQLNDKQHHTTVHRTVHRQQTTPFKHIIATQTVEIWRALCWARSNMTALSGTRKHSCHGRNCQYHQYDTHIIRASRVRVNISISVAIGLFQPLCQFDERWNSVLARIKPAQVLIFCFCWLHCSLINIRLRSVTRRWLLCHFEVCHVRWQFLWAAKPPKQRRIGL